MKNRLLAVLLGPVPFLIISLLCCIPRRYAELIVTILGWIIVPTLAFAFLYFFGFLILMAYYKMCDNESKVDELIKDIFFWMR